jgi:hypothetical protein
VTAADLKERIETIMVNRIARPLNVTRKLLLALVSVAAIGIRGRVDHAEKPTEE